MPFIVTTWLVYLGQHVKALFLKVLFQLCSYIYCCLWTHCKWQIMFYKSVVLFSLSCSTYAILFLLFLLQCMARAEEMSQRVMSERSRRTHSRRAEREKGHSEKIKMYVNTHYKCTELHFQTTFWAGTKEVACLGMRLSVHKESGPLSQVAQMIHGWQEQHEEPRLFSQK